MGDQYLDDIERAEVAQLTRAAEEADAIVQVVRTYAGRMFISSLMAITGLDELPYAQGDPEQTNFNCGLQKAGKWAKDCMLTHAPETYILMQTEAQDRERRYAAEATATRGNEDGG